MKRYKKFISENVLEVPHISGKSKVKTNIPPEKRTLKNLPRDSKGKAKVHFSKWLGLKGNGSKGYDGKYYGWSHRAIAGFGVGDEVSSDSMAHKDYKWKYGEDDNKNDLKPYKIKTEEEAKEHAIRFMKAVS